jgi:peptidoglycan L-alanyl-D-glutamate endopeptidase CwlK
MYSLALVVVLPALAVAWRVWIGVSMYDHTDIRIPDQRIAALLAGERLVPPPPLPPEVFTTREVETVRPSVRYASRDWALLDAEFAQRLLMVFRIMKEQHGYEMVLLEGYRSPERQAELARRGGHVTQAGANRSYHQFGLAADSAFMRNGKVVITERDPWAMRGYELYGEVSASLGLTWGGAWRSIKDFGHVELRRPGVLRPAEARQDHVH